MAINQPSAGGDQFNAGDFFGALLLVYPKNFQADVQTKNGPSASADVDIIVVDRPGPDGQPQVFHNARLFGNLAITVSRDVGGCVGGRLGQGPNTKGNPPWILTPLSDQDLALATPVDTAYSQGRFQATATANPMQNQQQPPAQQQYQAPPPQQQYQAPPAQQYQTPAPQAAPAYAQQAPPTAPPQQQYQQPPQQQYAAPAQAGQPAAPAAAPAPVGADPVLLQRLAQFGINLPPEATQSQAEAVANTLPQ